MEKWSEQVKVCSGSMVEGPLSDGYSWRKYGQKDILGANHPRLELTNSSTYVYLKHISTVSMYLALSSWNLINCHLFIFIALGHQYSLVAPKQTNLFPI